MYWIGSTVVINLGRSFLHPSHFSQDEYFNRYLFQLGVAPTAANKVRQLRQIFHPSCGVLPSLVAKAQMMKFKPLDDCEVHGVWVGLPASLRGFAASPNQWYLWDVHPGRTCQNATWWAGTNSCGIFVWPFVWDKFWEVVSQSLFCWGPNEINEGCDGRHWHALRLLMGIVIVFQVQFR